MIPRQLSPMHRVYLGFAALSCRNKQRSERHTGRTGLSIVQAGLYSVNSREEVVS